MLDSKTKLLLIRAMVEGIDCDLDSIEKIDDFISVLKTMVEEN